MRILFAGGGTFGHVAPSLAAADALRERAKEIEIAFIGRIGGAENEAIRRAGYTLYEIAARSIRRKPSMQAIRDVLATLRSFQDAKKTVCNIAPDLVFGTGGYVCFPVMRAAQELGIPTLLHESNATPGRACRMLAPKCRAVLLGTRDCLAAMPKRAHCIYTGNPVRKDFYSYTRERARKILGLSPKDRLLLSFGGSGGSECLNRAMLDFMTDEEDKAPSLCHIHATGKKYYDAIASRYPTLTHRHARERILPFIENMPLYMRAADLCICRSGAMTVSELCAAQLPAILVPSPNVTDNHQLKNAESIQAFGGARICTEGQIGKIKKMILDLIFDGDALDEMRASLRKYACTDAADRIADTILSFLP